MSAGEKLAELEEQLYAAHWMMAAMQKRPRSFGEVTLYANEAHTLNMIARHEGISQTALSTLMLRTKGATSAMVDKLVEKGLVARQRVEGDQRRYLLTPTPLGRQVHEMLLDHKQTHASKMAQAMSFSSKELETAVKVLTVLVNYYASLCEQEHSKD